MNKEDIIEGGLYRLLETPNEKLETWCRHNLLIASKGLSDEFVFTDTYWNGLGGAGLYSFESLNDRIEFVFNMNHAEYVNRREWDEYEETDKTYIPIGGREEQWIVDDRAEKSNDRQILILQSDIDNLEYSINSKQNSLKRKKKELSALKEEKVKIMTKFVVVRTSEWGDEKPCMEAQKELAPRLDSRNAKTLSEAQKQIWYKGWYENGTNHRVEDGYVVCDTKKKCSVWTIQINTLEELLAFGMEYGKLIISSSDYKEIPFSIEIYDTYRE